MKYNKSLKTIKKKKRRYKISRYKDLHFLDEVRDDLLRIKKSRVGLGASGEWKKFQTMVIEDAASNN